MEAVFAASSLYFHGNSRGFVGAATTVARWFLLQTGMTTLLFMALYNRITHATGMSVFFLEKLWYSQNNIFPDITCRGTSR